MGKDFQMTTALVDGDIVLYNVCISIEYACDWGDDVWTLHSDLREGKQKIDIALSSLQEKVEAENMIVCLSDKENWRKTLFPSYKANRKSKRKPLVYPVLREYLKEVYTCAIEEKLEADDVLGLLATGFDPKVKDTIIISEDKDLKTIPGKLYNPNREEEGIQEISEEEADYNHLTQALTGDSTDGYSGCPSVGPKTAQKILQEKTWEEVVEAYRKQGLDEECALTQARLARILRNGEYNRTTKEVKLWKPQTTASVITTETVI